jgi:two-component system chemotaxis sensor kinase CheA
VAAVEELRQQIEDLATTLVVNGPPLPGEGPGSTTAVSSALDGIAVGADETGFAELASLARALRDDVQVLPVTPDEASGRMLKGITALQDACERAGTPKPAPSSGHVSLGQDPELLGDFVLEARDHLSSIEAQALVLERDPLDGEALNAAFRSFHTIKGLAGFLELEEVQHLSHEVETVLDAARQGTFRITRAAIDVFLESGDYLLGWLNHLEAMLAGKPTTPPARAEALLARIRSVASADATELPLDDPFVEPPLTGPESSEGLESSEPPASAPAAGPATAGDAPAQARSVRTEASSVKVDTAKLDYLVDMAGEMVIAQSLVQHDPDLKNLKTPRLQRNLAQLGRITAELQKTAMSMRLVPIGPVFHRMARLVRDLSRQFGKQVVLETEGDDIDLDRTIVEELSDPLMHMVRNALDHGIETPAVREAAGKPASARLLLRALHQAGQVVIEISDDGRGLDRDKILARGIERGLVPDGTTLTESETYNLIFEPGFTTAAQVTSVSGRGVGMDVVRRHVQALRGRIEIRSTQGKGTTFILKLPLTLAIIDGLVVSVGSERYILPLFSVREMFRPAEDVVWTVQQRGEMALVRGSLIPVTRLYRRFGVEPKSENPLECVLIVAEAEGRRVCIMVDELLGKQEVVIKSLGEGFKHVAGIAGGAILGDGRVGLILDLDGICAEGGGDGSR